MVWGDCAARASNSEHFHNGLCRTTDHRSQSASYLSPTLPTALCDHLISLTIKSFNSKSFSMQVYVCLKSGNTIKTGSIRENKPKNPFQNYDLSKNTIRSTNEGKWTSKPKEIVTVLGYYIFSWCCILVLDLLMDFGHYYLLMDCYKNI